MIASSQSYHKVSYRTYTLAPSCVVLLEDEGETRLQREDVVESLANLIVLLRVVGQGHRRSARVSVLGHPPQSRAGVHVAAFEGDEDVIVQPLHVDPEVDFGSQELGLADLACALPRAVRAVEVGDDR